MRAIVTSADLFRATWPRHTAKQVARAADSPVGTAKAWVQARFTPSANTLLRMARENRELRASLMQLLQEQADADMAAAAAAGDVLEPGHEVGAARRPGEAVEVAAPRGSGDANDVGPTRSERP